VSSKDGSSGELTVEDSPSVLLDLLDTTLLLVVGGDGGITESSDMDSVRSCAVANCPSAAGGKSSTVVGVDAYATDEVID